VREARPLLLTLAAQLRAEHPVSPRGLAAIRCLLVDGAGPVYAQGDPETLKLRLQQAEAWL
jgi:hypothetical protein